MIIKHVEIGNFRKLKAVRVDFSEATTVFVGANNSGKTSAIEALRDFLYTKRLVLTDFTLSNWRILNQIGLTWVNQDVSESEVPFDWCPVLPFLDIWFDVPLAQIHLVSHILPSISWSGSLIGVRLRYEPTDATSLVRDYVEKARSAKTVLGKSAENDKPASDIPPEFGLWPRNLMDYLSTQLSSQFKIKAYVLDPSRLLPPEQGVARPQELPIGAQPLDADPIKGLVAVDLIDAQRGFGFADSASSDDDSDSGGSTHRSLLTRQLRKYYATHLNPITTPEAQDIQALVAIFRAEKLFGERLDEGFGAALTELQQLGYPGITDPTLRLSTSMKPLDGLKHESAVQFEVASRSATKDEPYRLPEHSNGLGYQNLVSMVFRLMSFRDKWMRVGKAAKTITDPDLQHIPPLHLVLVEEPEAHLHAQVQQVFINHAYNVLRNHERLGSSEVHRTQLLVSTHSAHVAHEVDFSSLRYFRRLPAGEAEGSVPITSVVNLSEVFGQADQTQKFVQRYLKITHCDLFFADGAVLVEGQAERILLPHLVRTRGEYRNLCSRYITWLEIGGSHAHTLRSLVEHLGLNTLIITDIDAQDSDGKKAIPRRDAGLTSRNQTLKNWIPNEDRFDSLLAMADEQLVRLDASGYGVRVAFQRPISVSFKSATPEEALANTFEDALFYENIAFFQSLKGTGLISSFCDAADSASTSADLAIALSSALTKGSKAQLALDLLQSDNDKDIRTPKYIHDGLIWLANQLVKRDLEVARLTDEGIA